MSSNDTAPEGSGSPFRTERTARDEAPQYVLPLVVRIEKAEPPARTDALRTAARAVLVMLSDDRALGEGEWAEAVRDWQDARIRKVVRRARGGEWRRAAELPGITVTGDTAQVRVFPPVPLDGWPKELAKLQVSGTELTDPEEPEESERPEDSAGPADQARETGPAEAREAGLAEAQAPGPAEETGPAEAPVPAQAVLWLNPDLRMSTGKEMAQVGHGAQLLWWELPDDARKAWREAGFPLEVRTAARDQWSSLTTSGLPVVRDAGFTEIAPGSCTVVSQYVGGEGPSA
ncbi:peptidyl-tRNA hydrolase [Streptomyces sp. NPDC001941]|uniref:peptidyl-tRNA hydrolase n=1 Tax=Streptomyces sp. NPDC001941 TaxID=3154659 RepID=UPI00332840E7